MTRSILPCDVGEFVFFPVGLLEVSNLALEAVDGGSVFPYVKVMNLEDFTSNGAVLNMLAFLVFGHFVINDLLT